MNYFNQQFKKKYFFCNIKFNNIYNTFTIPKKNTFFVKFKHIFYKIKKKKIYFKFFRVKEDL